MTLGQCLQIARANRNMTLMECQEKAGVSFRAIRSWERDEHSPQFDKLEALCLLAYEMPVQDLLHKYHYNGIAERIVWANNKKVFMRV